MTKPAELTQARGRWLPASCVGPVLLCAPLRAEERPGSRPTPGPALRSHSRQRERRMDPCRARQPRTLLRTCSARAKPPSGRGSGQSSRPRRSSAPSRVCLPVIILAPTGRCIEITQERAPNCYPQRPPLPPSRRPVYRWPLRVSRARGSSSTGSPPRRRLSHTSVFAHIRICSQPEDRVARRSVGGSGPPSRLPPRGPAHGAARSDMDLP